MGRRKRFVTAKAKPTLKKDKFCRGREGPRSRILKMKRSKKEITQLKPTMARRGGGGGFPTLYRGRDNPVKEKFRDRETTEWCGTYPCKMNKCDFRGQTSEKDGETRRIRLVTKTKQRLKDLRRGFENYA